VTDRLTDHTIQSVITGRIYVHSSSTAVRPSNGIKNYTVLKNEEQINLHKDPADCLTIRSSYLLDYC